MVSLELREKVGRERTWMDQQTAPRVPRTLAAIGISIFGHFKSYILAVVNMHSCKWPRELEGYGTRREMDISDF